MFAVGARRRTVIGIGLALVGAIRIAASVHGRNAKLIFRTEIALDAESAALYQRPERHFRGRRRASLK